MFFLLTSIVLSVLLLLNFRIFPKYQVNTFQAIVFNYPVCFLTGLLLMPQGQQFGLDFSQTWTYLALLLGIGFIFTFILSGLSTQKMGITATSLANNISLVIPVCMSLFVFKVGKAFDILNYAGLLLALLAVGLSTFKKNEEGNNQSKSLVYLPIAVFLMYGLTNTLINFINIRYITSVGATIPVTLVMILGAIITGFILLVIRRERIEKQSFVAAITLGIPNFLSFYMLIRALSAFGGNGAFVYPVYNIGVIVLSALSASIFFKEKLTTLNKLGLLVAIVAIGLLSWQELGTLL